MCFRPYSVEAKGVTRVCPLLPSNCGGGAAANARSSALGRLIDFEHVVTRYTGLVCNGYMMMMMLREWPRQASKKAASEAGTERRNRQEGERGEREREAIETVDAPLIFSLIG